MAGQPVISEETVVRSVKFNQKDGGEATKKRKEVFFTEGNCYSCNNKNYIAIEVERRGRLQDPECRIRAKSQLQNSRISDIGASRETPTISKMTKGLMIHKFPDETHSK